MPFSQQILLSKGEEFMTNKISSFQKRASIPFIRASFSALSQREIARKLGIGKTTVNRWTREIGLEFKKHTVNENFFDVLNEESAYLLGLIYSDGNIAYDVKKGYYAITITASEKDKEHLEKIRALISSTKPLLYSPKTKSYRLIIHNKILCNKLMRFGLTPRKSLTITLPIIPKDQFRHFLRGVIDGDGSVMFFKRKRSPYFDIRIYSGSRIFCEGLMKAIYNSIGLKTTIRKANKSTYQVRYCCRRGEKLAEFIYSDATLFLERKYLPYKNNVMEVDVK